MRVSFVKAAGIAARQNGRITTEQLRACGFGNSSIENGVRSARLHRLHTNVYAWGHLAPSRIGDWHAAVLACGTDALLSHRSAAAALGIRDRDGRRIDVTIPPGSGRRRPGIAIHRSPVLPFEHGVWRDIPVTSPARTIVDLAHQLRDEEGIEWAMREMQFRRLFERRLLELSNQRRPNRTISRLLASIEPTRSRLEVAFLHRVVHRYNLPAPRVNERVEGFLVDFLWSDERLVVETDGQGHDQPMMRLADAHRDAVLEAAGFAVLRFRWADVHVHHERTAAVIRAALTNSTL
jgi:very-short-patch-repair endonuclease